MKRATLVYVVMFLFGVAGLWAVLYAGRGLETSPDLSGDWVLLGDQGSIERASIEQSGLFLRIAFGDEPFADFRLEQVEREGEEWRSARLIGESEVVTLRRGAVTTAFTLERRSTEGGVRVLPARRAAASDGDSRGEASDAAPQSGPPHTILLLIAQLAVVIVFSRILGLAATLIGQPRVVGEMVAGLMLGPSLLGWVWPAASATLFPADSIVFLGLLAQLGVIFFLFVIGLELDPKLIRNRGHVAIVISHVSILVPFLFGGVLGLYLYGLVFHDTPQMRFAPVALFMGAAMSVTAFPVLARILTERNIHKTQVGAITITCAAVDDVSAWCLLAFVGGLSRAQGIADAALTTTMALAYVCVMVLFVRPFLARLEAYHDREGELTTGVLGVLIVVVLLSALATEAIGIHALFGAFMAGAIMPKGTRFVRDVAGKIEEFTLIVLLPIFFAFTGLKTRIELINTPELWLLTGLIIAVACAGKFGGSTIAGRACGLGWRESAAIGVLMNTRGLMQLVILEIGRELGVITDAVFAMMVLMALVTTFLTTPILRWVYPDRLIRAKPVVRAGARRHDSILIPISLPRSGRALVQLADLITGPDNANRRVVGLHLTRAEEHDAYAAAAGGPPETAEPLLALQASGAEIGVTVEPVSLVSMDTAGDIARLAEDYNIGLVLMGFHKPIIGTTILGGTVHRVLQQAPADVAVFVDRGFPNRPQRILVPYLGSDHDRLALEIASTMARYSGAAVTVLHVVPPKQHAPRPEDERLDARAATEKVFTDPTQPAPVTFRVVESPDPISTVIEQGRPFDLVLIGVAEKWGLTSQLFGWRAERIARDCPTSMLIVRKAMRPSGLDRPAMRTHEAGAVPAHPQTGGGVDPAVRAAEDARQPGDRSTSSRREASALHSRDRDPIA